MMFITLQFTCRDGCKVWIMMDKISSWCAADKGSDIYTVGDASPWAVRETPDEILAKFAAVSERIIDV